MTDLEKAARMALGNICSAKLCEINSMSSRQEMIRLMDEAITALRQALSNSVEQPAQQEPFKPDWVNYRQGVEDGRAEALEMLAKQEPVGYVTDNFSRDDVNDEISVYLPVGTRIYTSPPASKPWVSLTDDDLDDIATAAKRGNLYDLRLAIEAKLKDKNA